MHIPHVYCRCQPLSPLLFLEFPNIFSFFFHKPPTSEFQPDSRQLWNPLFACIINYHPLFSIQKDHQLCTAERRIVLVPEVVAGWKAKVTMGKGMLLLLSLGYGAYVITQGE